VQDKALNFHVIFKFLMKFIKIIVLHRPVSFEDFTAVVTKIQPSRIRSIHFLHL